MSRFQSRRRHRPLRLGIALQAREVGAHLTGALVAQLTILFERLADDVLEPRRKLGVHAPRRRRRAVQNRFANNRCGVAHKRLTARRHLVKHQAETE